MSSITPGRHLMIGLQGKALNRESESFLRKVNPSGIIFFSRNIESAEQLKKFIEDIRNILTREAVFAIDHEGGLVQRFSDSLTSFPGNMALGKTGREDWAYQQGCVMARELAKIGLGINFAPVVDVLTKQFNPGITIRSFGENPEKVALLAQALIRGMQNHGIAATAKHFPGKGAATVDAHEDLPTVMCSREDMEKVHLVPFKKAVEAGVSFVMTTHVMYPYLDSQYPATFSKIIAKNILRDHLLFDGVVISDDLEMGAIVKRFPFEEAVVRSIEAGHDFVLVCHQPELIMKAVKSLEKAYQDKKLDEGNLNESLSRLKSAMGWVKNFHLSNPVSGIELANQIAQNSVELVGKGSWTSKKNSKGKVLVLAPDLASVMNKFFFENELLGKKSLFSQEFDLHGWNSVEYKISLDQTVSDQETQNWPLNIPVVFFCFDAVNYPGQRVLLEKVQKRFKDIAIVLIRNPYDEQYIQEGVTCIQAYGFRSPQIKKSVEILMDL